MIVAIKINGEITQYIENCEEIPEGFVEVTAKEIAQLKNKNELTEIEQALRDALPRFNELKELGEMRSTHEEQEFSIMTAKKQELLERRQELLNA